MDKKTLVERRNDAEKRFNEHKEVKDQTESELYRLQGEHRVLTELIEKYDNEDKPVATNVPEASNE